MFIGKSLKGRTVKISKHELNNNFANTFLVKDGMMEAALLYIAT
jgi:hypothetical protein